VAAHKWGWFLGAALVVAAGLVAHSQLVPQAQAPAESVGETRCDDISKPKCAVQLVTGIRMAYLEAGAADGEAVLLLHGLTDSSRTWSWVMPALLEMKPDLRLFALDQRGHGDTSMPNGAECPKAPESCFRMADFADDVVAFMNAKGIERATLVGHSMGSFVAQELALRHPDMVSRIVLIATSTKVAGNAAVRDYILKEPVEGAWKAALEARGIAYPDGVYELTPKDADPRVEDWILKWYADPVAAQEALEPFIPETARVKLGTWIGATKALLATDNSERLKALSVPSLIIWGTQDNTFLESDQSLLKAALDAAASASGTPYYWKRYGAIPLPQSGQQESDIGHGVPWDAPRELAADIVSFITAGRPTSDLCRADAPNNLTTIVTGPGLAEIVHRP
jgi:pimeloyl-ACP methyl ester carboxylesterase